MNTAGTPSLSDLVIERVGFGLFVLDRAMNVLMWNRFMQDHSGTVAADVIGRNLFDCFPDLPRAWLERKLQSVFQLGSFAFSSWEQRPYLFRFEHDRPITGGVDYMQQDCTFMPLTRGRDVEAVCVTISDVTHVSVMQREREEAVAKLREHANVDGLTGIANRRYFEARLGDEFARWQRYGGDLSVLLFDLDHFKTINDRFGHAVGDAVLVFVWCYLLLESCIEVTALLGLNDIPHLTLAHFAMLSLGHLIVGMHLDTQVAPGIDELDEQG